MRQVVTLLIIGYAIFIFLLFLAMEFLGESWWPIAILLYLPQEIFLLPLIVLTPAALLAEVSLGAYATLGGVLIIFLWHVPLYIGIGASSGPSGPVEIKIMTNNYGQNHRLPLEPFIAAENPDFVALEDAFGQAAAFQRAYPDRWVRQVGQFVLVSKAPITAATSLEWPRWRGNPIAAVYEVAWQGQELAIYTVHLPTPRGDFAKLTGLGLIREMLGRNRRRSDDMSFGESMTARVQLGRDLAAVLARERRPFVAAGDFNMPEDGLVRRIVSWGLADCFQEAGRGFGFTFPGDTHNPLTFGGPWLRIDYVLAGPGWHVSECQVEPSRRSQHRAVVATLSRN